MRSSNAQASPHPVATVTVYDLNHNIACPLIATLMRFSRSSCFPRRVLTPCEQGKGSVGRRFDVLPSHGVTFDFDAACTDTICSYSREAHEYPASDMHTNLASYVLPLDWDFTVPIELRNVRTQILPRDPLISIYAEYFSLITALFRYDELLKR